MVVLLHIDTLEGLLFLVDPVELLAYTAALVPVRKSLSPLRNQRHW